MATITLLRNTQITTNDIQQKTINLTLNNNITLNSQNDVANAFNDFFLNI